MSRGQLDVLNTLDLAKTQWYHFTAVIISGMGYFTDAYDLFCISLVTRLLGRIYYHVDGSQKPGKLPPNVASAVYSVAFCGALVGQLFFGWLGDKLGRKKVYGMTLMIMVVCSLASGLSYGYKPKGVMITLCFFRFWLGFGIGGDYPLSATIMYEYANKKTRAAVFAMQGFGIMAGGIFAIIISSALEAMYPAPAYSEDALKSAVPQADLVWRTILMFGAIPAAMTYYWRLKMPETARYTALVAKNTRQAAMDMSWVLQVEIVVVQAISNGNKSKDFSLFSKEFMRRHGLHLLGTTSTWFLLDIAYYSQTLFQKDIFRAIGWLPPPETMNAIQLMGFIFTTVFMFAMAIRFNHWTQKENQVGFVVLYSLTLFFSNFGPRVNPFVVPAEIFPARFRSTCHGISAASGKLGTILGAFGFLYLAHNPNKPKTTVGHPQGIGVRNWLIALGVFNFLGIIFTFLVPETKGKSLEDISGENEGNANNNNDSRTVFR